MSKQQKGNLVSRKDKTKPPEIEGMLEDERNFREIMRDFTFLRVETPLDVFKRAFKFENIKITFENEKDAKNIYMLILKEILIIMEKEEDIEAQVKNILSIFNREDLKKFIANMSAKIRESKKIASEFVFVEPKDDLMLQKLGRVLKKIILRYAFFTSEAFGQVKEKDKKVMVKPNLFKDQEAQVERKNEILAVLKAGKDKSDRKVFAWPDKKKIESFDVRVTYTDSKKRQRAIYCNDTNQATMFKNIAIIRRILDKDPNIKAKINQLKAVFKVKKAEGFYKRHLQKMYRDSAINERIFIFNETLKNKLKGYLKRHLPNLYDSNYNPKDLYNFEDNSHLVFKKNPDKDNEDDLEIIKRQLATIINPEMFIKPDSDQIVDKKKKIYLGSPFEEIYREEEFNDALFLDMLDSFRHDRKILQITHSDNSRFLEYLVSNSKMLLKFHKLILTNVLHMKEFPFESSEIDKLAFDIEMFVEKGNYASKGSAFVREVDPGYIAFDVQNSIKVDINSLKHLHIKIVDKFNGKEYFNQVINIQNSLDSVFLETPLTHEFNFNYKNFEGPASMFFSLAFVPRNLEIAHVTLSPQLLKANFDKFEGLVKNSEDYEEYRKSFFPSRNPLSLYRSNLNFFHYYNLHLDRDYFPLIRQEHLFANGFREKMYDRFVSLLRDISKRETNLNEILLNTSAKLSSKDKLNLNPYYDLIVRISHMLTWRERLLLNRIVFDYQYKQLVNLNADKSDFGFHKIMVDQINKALNAYFEKHPHIRPDQKALIQKLTFEIYVIFENNAIEGFKCKIEFSPLYIPLISNVVQLNSFYTSDADLLFLCVSHILSGNFMRKHSDSNHLTVLDSLVIYFRMIFKNQYADFFGIVQQFGLEFDTLILSALMNSLASFMDPINFGIYNDFKNALNAVFIIHNQNIPLIGLLKEMEINFGSLIDVLFLLAVFVGNATFIKTTVTPLTFRSTLEDLIVRESFNLRANFAKVIDLLDFALDHQMFKKDFLFFKNIVKTRHEGLITSYKNISLNIKSLKVDFKVIKRILAEEIANNSALHNRALSLYSFPPTQKPKTKKQQTEDADGEDENTSEAPTTFVEHDIYFDILEEQELEAFTDVQESNQNLPKYTATLVFLNNLDYMLIHSLSHNQKLVPDLNNIAELTLDDMNKFFMKYFSSSEALKMELYNDLANIVKAKKIPLFKLLLILFASFSEDPKEQHEAIEMLAKEISRLYFPDQPTLIFNEVVKYIVDEINTLLPLTYFNRAMQNSIDVSEKDLYCNIKSAKISLSEDVIDVTEIAAKHFASNSFLNKRPSILFGVHFCNDLCTVFQDLADNQAVDTSITKFELTIEYYNKGNVDSYNIPFRVGFPEYVKIVCNHPRTFYFDNYITEQNLLAPETLQKFVQASPFYYFYGFNSLKLSMNFVGVPFTFKFKSKELFLTANVTFDFDENTRVCSGLMPWKYTTENFQKLSKFETSSISLTLNYAYFFLPVRQIYEVLSLFIIQRLGTADIFKFIKLNNHDNVVTTSKNKSIEPGTHLYELTDYDRAVKRLDDMFVVITYNS